MNVTLNTPPEQPFEIINGRLDSGVVFMCDHASNSIPDHYQNLGMSPQELQLHSAYDIGAAEVTRVLAQAFDAPAVLSNFSRLLIDPNRGLDDPTLITAISDGMLIPGNYPLESAEIEVRIEKYWRAYRNQVRLTLDQMLQSGSIPAIISIHSFTPKRAGSVRPWHIGILWDSDPRLAVPLITALRRHSGLTIGDNEPYDGALYGDMLYEAATLRGLPNVLIEFRQDLISNDAEAKAWADRLVDPLRDCLAIENVHEICYFNSRSEK